MTGSSARSASFPGYAWGTRRSVCAAVVRDVFPGTPLSHQATPLGHQATRETVSAQRWAGPIHRTRPTTVRPPAVAAQGCTAPPAETWAEWVGPWVRVPPLIDNRASRSQVGSLSAHLAHCAKNLIGVASYENWARPAACVMATEPRSGGMRNRVANRRTLRPRSHVRLRSHVTSPPDCS